MEDIAPATLFKLLILPPAGPILLSLVGILWLPKRRHLGTSLLVTGVLLSYLCSIPFTASVLNRQVQRYAPLAQQSLDQLHADAIVVLAGGLYKDALEYPDGTTVNLRTLGRVRYAARLARQTQLPLLASGGYQDDNGLSEAELMQRLLEKEFGISNVLIEKDSNNTWENAFNSASVLKSLDVDTILLVTNAAHMLRAVEAFQRAGLQAIPAPSLFFDAQLDVLDPKSWLPANSAAQEIHYALYEQMGRLWYRWRAGW